MVQMAFSLGTDCSGMPVSKLLYIAEVIHKGFVAVNKSGTEAAKEETSMA